VANDEEYLEGIHQPAHPVLLELERLGHADKIPIVSHETGRLLSTLVHCMQANRILEIGTAYGFSTLWMALALPPAGHIWTIDPDRERTKIAHSYWERAGKADAIEVINQPALEVLPTFPVHNLDIIFIDAIKTEYAEYLEASVPLLKRSGLVVVDNLLWSGRAAAEPSPKDSEDTKAIRAFNKLFLNHPLLDATIIPLGDGTGIGAKLDE
jgi:predicted O-methyltransferase YrrM